MSGSTPYAPRTRAFISHCKITSRTRSDFRMSARRRYWLMKSEPDAFSIDALQDVGTEPWTGVRNYQARNFMRNAMKPGDGILFYHSNCSPPGIVGTATVASAAYPDPTQFDPKSDSPDRKATPE